MYLNPLTFERSIVKGGKHDILIPMGTRITPKPPVCVGKVVGFIFLTIICEASRDFPWIMVDVYILQVARKALIKIAQTKLVHQMEIYYPLSLQLWLEEMKHLAGKRILRTKKAHLLWVYSIV